MNEQAVNRIRNRFENKIKSTEITLTPFPHFQVEDIWPEDVYNGFHEFNPLEQRKGLAKPWLQKHSSSNPHYKIRKQIDLYEVTKHNQKHPDVQFWNIIQEALFKDNWYARLIGDHFKTYFATQYGPLMDEQGSWAKKLVQEWFVQRHGKGYFIGPHTDRHDRVFTNIFSLPKDKGYEHLGTSLWTAQPGDISYGGKHFGFKGFTKSAQMEYKPNQLFVFFKSRWAFHAVEKFDEVDPTLRYGMQIQVYEPSNAFREITSSTEGYETLLDA